VACGDQLALEGRFSTRLGFKAIAAAGGDVSQFSIVEVRQAGVTFMNTGAYIGNMGQSMF
jgi:hypothetical protein